MGRAITQTDDTHEVVIFPLVNRFSREASQWWQYFDSIMLGEIYTVNKFDAWDTCVSIHNVQNSLKVFRNTTFVFWNITQGSENNDTEHFRCLGRMRQRQQCSDTDASVQKQNIYMWSRFTRMCSETEYCGVEIEHTCTKLNTYMLKLNTCVIKLNTCILYLNICVLYLNTCVLYLNICVLYLNTCVLYLNTCAQKLNTRVLN